MWILLSSPHPPHSCPLPTNAKPPPTLLCPSPSILPIFFPSVLPSFLRKLEVVFECLTLFLLHSFHSLIGSTLDASENIQMMNKFSGFLEYYHLESLSVYDRIARSAGNSLFFKETVKKKNK